MRQVNSMKKTTEGDDPADPIASSTHSVRLPGFIVDAEVGLGDVVKKATSYLGLTPCGGCERRAAALNRWMTFRNGRWK